MGCVNPGEDSPWPEVFAIYREHRIRRRVSPGTLSLEKCTFRRFALFCHKRRIPSPSRFTAPDFDAFAIWLRTDYRCSHPKLGQRLCPQSVRDTLQKVQKLFRFLVQEGEILLDPTRFFRIQTVPLQPVQDRAIRPDQVRTIARTLTDREDHLALRNRALLELLFGCGLRRAEVCGLDLGDVDLDRGEIWVRHAKGGRDRVAPVAGTARRWLIRYRDHARPHLVTAASGQAFFLTIQGRRPAKETLGYIVRTVAERAGIKNRITPHMLRHGYAISLLRGGANIREIQELLGHRRLPSTQRYTTLAIDDLKDAHRRSHPRERRRERRR